MTDILEEAKEYFQGEGHTFSVRYFSKKLISEVEKSREDIEALSKQANGMIIVDESEKIKALEKERDELKDKIKLIGIDYDALQKIRVRQEQENTALRKKVERKCVLHVWDYNTTSGKVCKNCGVSA